MSFWKKETLQENSQENNETTLSEEFDENNEVLNINLNKEQNISSYSQKEPTKQTATMRSALSAGTVIQGKLSFDTPVSIDGKLSGELFSSETVVIGQSGVVDAQIEVRSIVVAGKVTGNIKATEKATILAGAQVDGTLSAPLLSVEEGAIINCKFHMINKNASTQNY